MPFELIKYTEEISMFSFSMNFQFQVYCDYSSYHIVCVLVMMSQVTSENRCLFQKCSKQEWTSIVINLWLCYWLGCLFFSTIFPHACVTGWSKFKNGSVPMIFIIIFIAIIAVSFEWLIL